MPTPCSLSWRITRKRFCVSSSESEAVGSSRMRTLASAPSAPVDAPEQARLLDAERDVLRDGEFGEERRLLVDGDDAERLCDARRVVRDETPLDPDLAAVRLDRAGDDLNESGL